MRRNSSSTGSPALPVSVSLSQVTLVSAVVSLATAALALALLYPVTAVVGLELLGAAWLGSTLAGRVRASARSTKRLLAVRVPFTDLHVEV